NSLLPRCRQHSYRIHDSFDWILSIDRHQCVARSIRYTGERYREIREQPLACELFDCRRHACGRDRNPRHRQPKPVIVVEEVNGSHDILVVLQRLPHSHEYDAETVSRAVQHYQHLRNNFLRCEIAREAKLACETESTTQTTANLRRNAEGQTI